MTCDDAKKNFEEFFEQCEHTNLSESDTRSKIIDKIIINVLGWSENDIEREKYTNGGYLDYKLSIAGFRMVIEAKKSFVKFIFPNEQRHKVKLRTIYSNNEEVINQIRTYLANEDCSYGMITNGEQFIFSQFINTNGKPWLDNYAIVYDGLQDVKEDFVNFWNNFSKESIINKGGNIDFLQIEPIKFSKTIFSTITENDNEITRNDVALQLSGLISKVFAQLFDSDVDNEDITFIKACFVENSEVIKNKAELNGLFSDEAPLLNNVIKARNHNSIIGQIEGQIEKDMPSSSQVVTPKPVIIIGSKGAGKTTFIRFLFANEIGVKTISDHPYVYVDLKKYYVENNELNFNNIAKDVLENFKEKYSEYRIDSLDVLKRIYIKEINSNDLGIWKMQKEAKPDEYNQIISDFLTEKVNNYKDHLEALNLYLTREIHKRAIIIFDNADQLDDSIQGKVFLYAQSLYTKAKYGVFISLREGYYYKWHNSAPFDAFESNVYHIAAPDYGQVLQKRIDYAIEYIKKVDGFSDICGEADRYKMEIKKDDFEAFLKGLEIHFLNVPIALS